MSTGESAPRNGLALEPVQQFLLYEAVDAGPALVLVADEDMNYLAVNNRACSVLGYSREELLAMRITDVVVSVDVPSLYEQMMNEGYQEGDVELLTKDGRRLPFIYEATEVQVSGLQYYVAVGFVNSKIYAKVGQLEQALLSRVVIEQAKGVLAGRHGIDTTTAFEALRGASRAHHLRIHDLARRTVEESDTPQEILARLTREARTRRAQTNGR